MQAIIELLMDEHREIERVLEALDAFVAMGQEDKQAVLRFVEFIREFADRIHHGKEEDILFEKMVEAGFPRQSGPLAVMYHEHDQGRAYVRELDALGRQEAPWSAADRQRLEDAAHGYTTLLRHHIHKEDNILYPMAVSQLEPAAEREIAERVDAFERAEHREKARLTTLADELARNRSAA